MIQGPMVLQLGGNACHGRPISSENVSGLLLRPFYVGTCFCLSLGCIDYPKKVMDSGQVMGMAFLVSGLKLAELLDLCRPAAKAHFRHGACSCVPSCAGGFVIIRPRRVIDDLPCIQVI